MLWGIQWHIVKVDLVPHFPERTAIKSVTAHQSAPYLNPECFRLLRTATVQISTHGDISEDEVLRNAAFQTKKTRRHLHFLSQMIRRPCCLKLSFTIYVYLPNCCQVGKTIWILISHWLQHHIFREKLVSLAWLTFLSSSSLQHTEALHWSALNPISNKTRCLARFPDVTTTLAQGMRIVQRLRIDQSFRGFHMLLSCLDSCLDHCLPCGLMTLQPLHAANELMDQYIDPDAAVYKRPITSSKQCRNWLRAQPEEQSTMAFGEEM